MVATKPTNTNFKSTRSAGGTSSKGVSNYDDNQLAEAYGSLKDRNPYFSHDTYALKTILQSYCCSLSGEGESKKKRQLSLADLACGNGYYARVFAKEKKVKSLLDLNSIVGVDISQNMIEQATRIEKEQKSPNCDIQYLAGDVNDPETIQAAIDLNKAENFDVCNAAFLINYFGTHDALVEVITSVKSMLKPHGIFMGMTQNPGLNLCEPTSQNVQRFGLAMANLNGNQPKDGDLVTVNINQWDGTNTIQTLDVVYWSYEAYERAFEKAGMEVEWVHITDSSNKESDGISNDEHQIDENEIMHWKHHPTIAFVATIVD